MDDPCIGIWNLRDGKLPLDFVIADRRTLYGNPFHMANESERDFACDEFERYAEDRLQREPEWLTPLLPVRGLACWCYPKRCHTMTLRTLIYRIRLERGIPATREGA